MMCEAKTQVFAVDDRVYVDAKALQPLVQERATEKGKRNVLTDQYRVFKVGETGNCIEVVGKRGRKRLSIKVEDAMKVSDDA